MRLQCLVAYIWYIYTSGAKFCFRKLVRLRFRITTIFFFRITTIEWPIASPFVSSHPDNTIMWKLRGCQKSLTRSVISSSVCRILQVSSVSVCVRSAPRAKWTGDSQLLLGSLLKHDIPYKYLLSNIFVKTFSLPVFRRSAFSSEVVLNNKSNWVAYFRSQTAFQKTAHGCSLASTVWWSLLHSVVGSMMHILQPTT